MTSKNKPQTTLEIANTDACFDLQFRKDTRHDRAGSPTYWRWKIQFIITLPKDKKSVLEKIRKEFSCGTVTISKNQARLAVQKIDDLTEYIIPYFKRNLLSGNKKKDFNLWQKAAIIIFENKGKKMLEWKKSDLHNLLQIHTTLATYKQKPRKSKWMDEAKLFANQK